MNIYSFGSQMKIKKNIKRISFLLLLIRDTYETHFCSVNIIEEREC